jgi:hypothetical protein
MNYKPTQGVTSKGRAEKFLKKHFLDYNIWDKICPFTGDGCHGYGCAAWENAKVKLDNPGRMRSEDSVYDIVKGYCKSPAITGVIKVKK